ncbi:hypothetical protein VM1G_08835 [Cytospora mali]|uniref:Uncharacterized protein n=1 Tax=Cytospora mali TaxID=578113 RepID=A0A194WAJ9_CYTMA|nr:hypothetical protein VM1G_08835 [Valsa mali]
MASLSPNHQATTAVLLLGLFSALSTAMTPSNGVQFLFPTQGAALHYNDYVEVQYISNFTAPWLIAFCLDADGHVGTKQSQGVGGFNNTATVKLNWSGSDTPCWFDLKPNSSSPAGEGANSDQWSFDVSQRAATTVGLTATSTTSTSTSTSAGSSGASASSTASAGSSTQSSGLSAGAQAGIGVGVAIVGICVGAVAVFMCMRRRRQQTGRKEVADRIEENPGNGQGVYGAEEVKYPDYHQGGGAGGYLPAHELHGAPDVYEMPTHPN